jgi:hypothetical protein
VLATCSIGENVLWTEWAVQVWEQTKPLPCKLTCYSINISLIWWFSGQSYNQAQHAINSILALEKSLSLLEEKMCSLELQLMGDEIFDSTNSTNIPQQLEDSCAQHAWITDSLHRKRVALGVNEHAYLISLRWSAFLCICMNACALKHWICDCLCQHKFELEKLKRAYRHTVNGRQFQLLITSYAEKPTNDCTCWLVQWDLLLHAGIFLLDADMKLVLPFCSLVTIQSTWVLTQSVLLQVTSLPTCISYSILRGVLWFDSTMR